LVGAEGEDFLALGSEAEVRGDDGEDAFFGEQGEEAGGEDVDAGEGEGLQRRWFSGFGKWRVALHEAAAELAVVVEEEGARRFAGLDGEGGEGVMLFVELEHAGEVDGTDDVDVVEEERLIETSGIFEEEPGGFFKAAAGVEENVFAGDFEAHAKVFVRFQVVDDLVGEVVDVDDDFSDAESAEAGEGDFEKRAAGKFDESLRASVG